MIAGMGAVGIMTKWGLRMPVVFTFEQAALPPMREIYLHMSIGCGITVSVPYSPPDPGAVEWEIPIEHVIEP